MGLEMATIPTLEELKRLDTSHDLILSLSLNEEIIQFNKESERFTGYTREEVIHRKLSEVLIPKESATLWKNLFDSIQHDLWIDKFELPIQTKDNHVHIVTWTGFLVKDEHDVVKDICIFGKPVKSEPLKQTEAILPEPVRQEKEPDVLQEIPVVSPPPRADPLPLPTKRDMPVRHGVNRIMFAREKAFLSPQAPPIEEQIAQRIVKPEEKQDGKPGEKPVGLPTQKLELLHESLSELLEKYEMVSKRVAELEKKESALEKKPEQKKVARPPVQEQSHPPVTKQSNDKRVLEHEEQGSDEEKPSFFSDPFGLKRQHTEISLKQQQIELRSKELEAFEARLLRQERALNTRVEEFSKWQEKLILLESAIEKRRQELMNQENFILGTGTVPAVINRTIPPKSGDLRGAPAELPPSNEETLEKIPQSAAIIQRGIVKQINTPFLELLGYSLEEILEKSYFDFIALEGLADVEEYYLNRLKGESISMYKTVFSTKTNTKLSAEVSIKQTIYKGEKAEIAIITRLNLPSV